MSPDPRDAASMATVSAGASVEQFHLEARLHDLGDVWAHLPGHVGDAPPPLREHLGPLNWSPIVIDGVPVAGWAQLTLFRTGAVNFTGHFRVSGLPSYDIACAFAVRASDGTVYTFTSKGRVHGTLESGPRDFDWGGQSPMDAAVAAGWGNLAAGFGWQARAGVNVDVRAMVRSVVDAVGEATSIVAVIV